MKARLRRITWSPSVTLVPTHHCFNSCSYCGFRRSPPPGIPSVMPSATLPPTPAWPSGPLPWRCCF